MSPTQTSGIVFYLHPSITLPQLYLILHLIRRQLIPPGPDLLRPLPLLLPLAIISFLFPFSGSCPTPSPTAPLPSVLLLERVIPKPAKLPTHIPHIRPLTQPHPSLYIHPTELHRRNRRHLHTADNILNAILGIWSSCTEQPTQATDVLETRTSQTGTQDPCQDDNFALNRIQHAVITQI